MIGSMNDPVFALQEGSELVETGGTAPKDRREFVSFYKRETREKSLFCRLLQNRYQQRAKITNAVRRKNSAVHDLSPVVCGGDLVLLAHNY